MTDFTEKPIIGMSACLLGKEVRHDGSHRRNRYITDTLVEYVDYQSICPEMEIGLGVPRETIQLRRQSQQDEIKLVFSKNPAHELTDSMRELAHRRINSMPTLDGFVVKKDSPSCGLTRVPVFYEKTGQRQKNGIGIFTQELLQLLPHLPVEDEGRLHDHDIRENFLERVYAHQRWRQLAASENPLHDFKQFHQRYKLMLMAKHDASYRQLGRIAASATRDNLAEVRNEYFALFMETMKIIPKPGHHVNVLQHIMGYLKQDIDSQDKAELLQWLDNYRKQRVNRVTPIALIRHHLRRFPKDYLASQYYFSPYPKELMVQDQV